MFCYILVVHTRLQYIYHVIEAVQAIEKVLAVVDSIVVVGVLTCCACGI